LNFFHLITQLETGFLIQDFAVVMIVAAIMVFVTHKLKQPMVIGYILAGMLIGPFTPPFSLVHNVGTINTLAELGIIILLFVIGTEFPITKLKSVGRISMIVGIAESLGTLLVTFFVARTLGFSLEDFLAKLKAAGLSTLPGTAAEILDPEVRAIICPDKVSTDEWLDVMRAAHGVGLRSTATIMFGHVDHYSHWANHLLQVRSLQEDTGGFTEFVPLPFVHMEAPIWQKGKARSGPSYREAVLMHAVARIVLHPVISNIQVSWVKMGADGAAAILQAGANDLGGILMDESITRAAGGVNGQQFGPAEMQTLAASIGRPAEQRTTLYGRPAFARDLVA